MDHWVSVLSFLILAGPGKDLMILFRDCGFFCVGGVLNLGLSVQVASFAGEYGGAGTPEGMANPSQDG